MSKGKEKMKENGQQETKRKANEKIDNIKSEAKNIGESLKERKNSLNEKASNFFKSAKKSAQAGFDEAVEKGKTLWGETADKRHEAMDFALKKGNKGWEGTKKYAQEKPGNALGYIFLAGFLIGAWIYSRDQN